MRLRLVKSFFSWVLLMLFFYQEVGAEQQSSARLQRKVLAKVAFFAQLSGNNGESDQKLLQYLQKTLKNLGDKQNYELVPVDVSGGSRAVYEEVKKAQELNPTPAYLAALGNFEAKALLMAARNSKVTVILPRASHASLLTEGIRVVSFRLPSRKEGEVAAQWARERFPRILLVHSDANSEDTEFALGFESQVRGHLSKNSKKRLEKWVYSERSPEIDSLKEILKKLQPQLIVMPSQNSQRALWFLEALKSFSYARAVLGTEGWLSPDSLTAKNGIWISKSLLSPFSDYQGPDEIENPDYRAYREAVLWMNGCFSHKKNTVIRQCLERVESGQVFRITSKNAAIHFRARKMKLLELAPGSPRNLATLKVLD